MPSIRRFRSLVLPVLVAAGLTATAAFAATTASAQVASPDTAATSRCSHPISGDQCVSVTGIDKGSYLSLHKAPNYSDHGTFDPAVRLHNGDTVDIDCYTRGSSDADGNGDTYWYWSAHYMSDGYYHQGYINDYYLTTGDPSTFIRTHHMRHC